MSSHRTPHSVEQTLRDRFPLVVVHRQESIAVNSLPDEEIWYFYRDGGPAPSAAPTNS
jgi:hypothetical protein